MKIAAEQIRADFYEKTITVYQAYSKDIANTAVLHQTFVSPPFKMNRMTWIKLSLLWMMYRSGWATKPNQEHILAIKITREGFEWALKNACLSHFDPIVHCSEDEWKKQLQNAPVRIQWDPERDIYMNKLDYRAIQIGLSGIAVQKYVKEWIVSVEDITALCKTIYSIIPNSITYAHINLPKEKIYKLTF